MPEAILPQLWMLVPLDERRIIIEAFDLTRTGHTEIRDDVVISDGYTSADLALISRERMAAWVGEPEDTELSFARLWELTVAKARSIANPPVATMASEDGVMSLEEARKPAAITSDAPAAPAPKTTTHAKGTKKGSSAK